MLEAFYSYAGTVSFSGFSNFQYLLSKIPHTATLSSLIHSLFRLPASKFENPHLFLVFILGVLASQITEEDRGIDFR